ncbi:MAG: DNA cytosine methyltransferase [bacterium]
MNVTKGTTKTRPIGIDLFAGVGGMSLGFEQAGFDVAAAIEQDPINIRTHMENFRNCKTIRADLSRLSGRDLLDEANLFAGSVDVVFGGPPCQGFSLIGKREIQDERNQLLLHFARLVREIQPRYFVLENVPGLLLGDAIELFRAFSRQIRRAGYELVEPVRVLNATEFGIPQKRQRAFLLGFKKEIEPPSYPEPASICDDCGQFLSPTVWDAIGDLAHLDDCPELFESDRYHGELGSPSRYVKSLCAYDTSEDGIDLRKILNGHGLGGCFRTKHSDATRRRFADTTPGTTEKISRFFRLACDGIAPTPRAGTGPDHGSHTAARPIHPKMPRCITTREAARLHSFPDWFEFHPTKWHGFRQVGNSVPPLLARAVARCVIELLSNNEYS